MRRSAGLVAALAVALVVAADAPSSPSRASGTFQLKVEFHLTWSGVACPPGAVVSGCFQFVGDGVAPGLGRATVSYTLLDEEPVPGCHHFDFSPVVIEIAGKGQLYATLVDPKTKCIVPPNPFATLEATFTGGSGSYEGASGNSSVATQIIGSDGGTSIDSWTGILTVPGLEFDVTAPVLSGARSKSLRAPKGAKRIRVRYTVTAQDAVDGSLATKCKPKSGSFFKLGRTKVTCSATDSSGNTATATFRITVTRSR